MLPNSTHIAHAGHPTLPEKLFSSMGETAVPSVAKLRSRSRGGLPPRPRRSVREFIEAHLEENISIQALAATAGLSMYHFARAFKQSEGVTPHHYWYDAACSGRRTFWLPRTCLFRRSRSRPDSRIKAI